MSQIPLLFLADAITSSTGLARVCRDLATRVHADMQDTFRVGTLGVGGPISTSSKFPFPNYSILRLQQMLPMDLPDVYRDHAGFYGDDKQADSTEDLEQRKGQLRKGTLAIIWNLSWCVGLSQPHLLPPGHPLREFLLPRPESVTPDHWQAISNPQSPSFSPLLLSRLAASTAPFRRLLYCPVDGHLPDGTLGHQLAPILQGFDSLLAYTRYGSDVIERTLEKWSGQPAVSTIGSIPHLPHGLDRAVFHPRPRDLARQSFFSRVSNGQSQLPLLPDQILLAMVATNSSRKLWQEFFQTAAVLLSRGVNVFLWGHTDALQPSPAVPAVHWNLPALAKQFGLEKRICITTARLTDDDLAWAYSAADCMIATSSEGMGFSPMEGLGCGLPVVSTTYAGSAEFTIKPLQVAPVSFTLESPYLIQRPLHDPSQIADKVLLALDCSDRSKSLLDPAYEWDNLWPRWREWLLKGVNPQGVNPS